jgi:hypothetical protein
MMRRIVSFHPIDLGFFDGIIGPLTVGEKINPEQFLNAAVRVRATDWYAKRYKRALESLLTLLEPPPPPSEGSMWDKVRSRLERFDYKPDPTAKMIEGKVDPDLHLFGRPFLIFEVSADRVSTIVDEFVAADGDSAREALILEQLLRVKPELGGALESALVREPTSDMSYRNDLLKSLKSIYGMARASRDSQGEEADSGPLISAAETAPMDLPWKAVHLHSRAVPFWVGRDVDGLETVCLSADVEPPGFLAPAWRLFSPAIEALPELRDGLTTELSSERDLGAFVSAEDVPELLAFLNAHGARIIQVATRHGVGPTCTTLLRKIRECAHYAQLRGMGYLEACGILPLWFDPEDDEDPLAEPRPG